MNMVRQIKEKKANETENPPGIQLGEMKPDQLSARTRHDRNESIETAKRGGLNVSASIVVEDLDIAKDEPQPSLKLNKNESTFKKEST